jgi:hypothetical protein
MDGDDPQSFVDAGATWLLWSCWPVDTWLDDMTALASSPPPL